MTQLLDIEATLGRRREIRNAPRTVDLDILAYDDRVVAPSPKDSLQLHIPHERMHERAFVINPLFDISPKWVHPKMGLAIAELKARLPAVQETRRMTDAAGLYGTEWRAENTPRPGA